MSDSTLQQSLARIDAWFARHRPRYFAALHPGAAPAELVGLPDAFRVLLAWHNGQDADFAGCFAEHWFLMSAAEIRAADFDQPGWLPFLDDDAGSYLCLDAAQTVRYVDVDGTEHPVVAPSLASWMQGFADDLEQGRYVDDPEHGDLLRKPT
jgi:cell wall assembly regulator SMI1